MTTTGPGPGGERHGVLHTHLPFFLTADGELWRDSAFGRSLAEYLTRIVVLGTRRAAGKRPGKVLCQSHAVVGGCPGVIETSLEQKPRRLEWWCPECGYDGWITGWEGTRWDRSKPSRRPTKKKTTRARGGRRAG